MATSDELREICSRYVKSFGTDNDAWVGLFAEDAVQEDPVGSPPNVGREAIRGFIDNMQAMFGTVGLEALGEPIIAGHEVAMVLRATAGTGADRVRLPQIVDVLEFDESGAITKLRAFYDMAAMVPDPA